MDYLENHWIIGHPMIRGGGDLGLDWHWQGWRLNKINSVLDLLSSFEYVLS